MKDYHQIDLATEFPEFKDRIHDLKTSNRHFRRLYEEYCEVSKSIHLAEERVELMSERAEEDLRKKRLTLKDELYGMLRS
jgi:uncharacterized protein